MSLIDLDDQQQQVIDAEAGEQVFASPEARRAYEKAKRQRLVVRVMGALAMVLIICGVVLRLAKRDGEAVDPHAGHDHAQNAESEKTNLETVGLFFAKVKITAILPEGSDCHSSIAKLLSEMASKVPDKIQVNFQNMEQFSKEELSKKVGTYCAAVIINEKTDHEVIRNGKRVRISLIGTEPSNYKLEDLSDIVIATYKKEYGEPFVPLVKRKKKQAECLGGTGTCGAADGSAPSTNEEKKEEPILDLKLPKIRSLE